MEVSKVHTISKNNVIEKVVFVTDDSGVKHRLKVKKRGGGLWGVKCRCALFLRIGNCKHAEAVRAKAPDKFEAGVPYNIPEWVGNVQASLHKLLKGISY